MVRFFLALVLAGALSAQTPRKLIVISIDGLDARFLSDSALRVKVPNIRKLMREGAAATVVGVAPSDTWPGHASLVTGVSPWQHGIVSNEGFFGAASFKAPTLWDAAAGAGLKTATVYWPSTVGANVAWDLPEYWDKREGNAVPLEAIAAKATPPGMIPAIEQMFPRFEKNLWDDSSAAQAATYLLSADRPSVIFIHFAEADAEQHDTGALSIYAREILENDDEFIGQIMAKMTPDTVIAIVSDHGFENSNYTVRPAVMLKRPVEVEDGLIGTRDPKVAAELRRMIGQGRKTGIAREVPMAEVRAKAPSLGRWVAAFDTMPNFIASADNHGPAVGPGKHLGVHGLWPVRPGYRSVFICRGPGVKPVKLGDIDLLQIAPTLADALALKFPSAKAKSLWSSISR